MTRGPTASGSRSSAETSRRIQEKSVSEERRLAAVQPPRVLWPCGELGDAVEVGEGVGEEVDEVPEREPALA